MWAAIAVLTALVIFLLLGFIGMAQKLIQHQQALMLIHESLGKHVEILHGHRDAIEAFNAQFDALLEDEDETPARPIPTAH